MILPCGLNIPLAPFIRGITFLIYYYECYSEIGSLVFLQAGFVLLGNPADRQFNCGVGGMVSSYLDGWSFQDDVAMEGVFVGNVGLPAVLHRGVPTSPYVLGYHPLLFVCRSAACGICEPHRVSAVFRDAAVVGAFRCSADVGVYRPRRGLYGGYVGNVDDAYLGEVYL